MNKKIGKLTDRMRKIWTKEYWKEFWHNEYGWVKESLKWHKGLFITMCSLIVLTILIAILSKSVWISEYIFARGISRVWVTSMAWIVSLFNFSIFEWAIIGYIISIITFFVLAVLRSKRKMWYDMSRGMYRFLVLTFSIIFLYTLSATPLYNRKPFELEYNEITIDETNATSFVDWVISDIEQLQDELQRDETGRIVVPYTFQEIANIIRVDIAEQFTNSKYLHPYITEPKPVIFSKFMSWNATTGLFFSPFGEANINNEPSIISQIPTMAHELGHSLGIMPENSANLFAAYVTLNSSNPYIRYAGYIEISGISAIAYYSGVEEEYTRLLDNDAIAQLIIDKNYAYEFWLENEPPLRELSQWINDFYLKFQGQEDGISSYSAPYEYEIVISPQEEIVINYSEVQKILLTIYVDNMV